MINSVYRTNKNYYPQILLEQCKFVVKEKKMPEYITDDIETSSDDSDREDSDEENPDEENSDEEKFNKENQAQNVNKKTNKCIVL